MPLRRYLRISKYSTLEVRIYVTGTDDPTWFSDKMLRSVVQLAKPLILPKLREEQAVKKKKQATRDTIDGEGFTASIYLQDVQTRHSVLDVDRTFEFLEDKGRRDDNPKEQFRESSPLFVPSQEEEEGEEEDRKKLLLRANYTGFSIYGKALVLIVCPNDQNREHAFQMFETLAQQEQIQS